MDREDYCPVCGAENHSCRASTEDVRVIGANIFPSLGHENMFRVEEDFWIDEAFIETDGTTSTKRRRIAKVGEVIPRSEAVRRGIIKA